MAYRMQGLQPYRILTHYKVWGTDNAFAVIESSIGSNFHYDIEKGMQAHSLRGWFSYLDLISMVPLCKSGGSQMFCILFCTVAEDLHLYYKQPYRGHPLQEYPMQENARVMRAAYLRDN